ncbi:hypothetical protein N9L92_03700 [Saprospiraceae bacterium]|nr:hypothetical protein [Saprospiraceae bacterium]
MLRLLFSISFCFIFVIGISQTTIPTPRDKSNRYEDHSLYYQDWLGSLVDFDFQLENAEDFSHDRMAIAYWNRFNAYYKLMPEQKSDLLYIFFDSFNYDKDYFCSEYDIVINSGDFHHWTKNHYGVIEKKMTAVCDCVFASYNQSLLKTLDNIKERDQRFRGGSKISSSKEQHKLDSLNLVAVRNIISKYGYPNRTLVGIEYEAHAFYVIQHSNSEVMKEFLPLIKENTEKNLISRKLLPYLLDRINMIEGKPQQYGTQSQIDKDGNSKIYKLQNDIKTTNELREQFDLRPLEVPIIE